VADWTYTPPERKPWDKRIDVPLPPDWTKRAAKQLRREPRCEFTEDGVRCIETATDVDHVVPRFEGGTDDQSNLQSLCSYHHDRKTQEESARARAAHRASVLKRFDFTEKHPLDI
jgi:5-methylcytosine-specific restriction endonuclease McrA